MEIAFTHSPFVKPVTDLLRELERISFFSHGLLIGSWPMTIYADHFTLGYAFATEDIDFAVENAVRVPAGRGETIPEILERLGYSPITDYSGIETFLHGTFEVEFITHRRGGVALPAVIIPPWQISAQPLPFIDILFIRPYRVNIEDFSICIPSPEAFVLHKLIVAQRRTGLNKEFKKEKDLQQCTALVEVVQAEEVQQICVEYRLSRETRKAIQTSCDKAGIILPGWQY
jgi:hypothetical protein